MASNHRSLRSFSATAFLAIGRLTISIALCFSGLLHLNNPFAFYTSVLEYRYFEPGFATLWLSLILPMCQVVIGIGVVLQPTPRWATIAAICLFGTFLVAQLGAWFRGLPIDCGCFGSFSHRIGLASLASVGFFWSVALGCVVIQRRLNRATEQ